MAHPEPGLIVISHTVLAVTEDSPIITTRFFDLWLSQLPASPSSNNMVPPPSNPISSSSLSVERGTVALVIFGAIGLGFVAAKAIKFAYSHLLSTMDTLKIDEDWLKDLYTNELPSLRRLEELSFIAEDQRWRTEQEQRWHVRAENRQAQEKDRRDRERDRQARGRDGRDREEDRQAREKDWQVKEGHQRDEDGPQRIKDERQRDQDERQMGQDQRLSGQKHHKSTLIAIPDEIDE